MNICENNIQIKPLMDEDVNLFNKWLDKEFIYKWFCPGGEEEKEAWMEEVNGRNGEYNYMKHFIVYFENKKIGFCLYFDCYFQQEYIQEHYGVKVDKNHVYEIGYLIGEENYLNKGIGKIIVKKLEEKILEIGGKEIFADPGEENIVSVKTLLGNGFIKIKDDDYRKKLKGKNNE
jgi:RimJ/RimL family protein N-acetyltransferase